MLDNSTMEHLESFLLGSHLEGRHLEGQVALLGNWVFFWYWTLWAFISMTMDQVLQGGRGNAFHVTLNNCLLPWN
jgi:hypothetical protein